MMNENPIIKFGIFAVGYGLTNRQLMKRIKSPTFLKNVTEKHLYEVADCVLDLANEEQDIVLTIYYAEIMLQCAEAKKVDGHLWAFINYVYGTALIDSPVYLYDDALTHLNYAKIIYSNLPDTEEEVAGCNINMGIIYERQGRFEKALEVYDSAIIFFRKIESKIGVATCYLNKGIVLDKLKHPEKAFRSYQKAEENLSELKNVEHIIAKCELNTALVYKKLGKNNEAGELIISARKKFDSIGQYMQVSICDINNCNLLKKKGDYDKAILRLNDIIESRKKSLTEEIAIKAQSILADAYRLDDNIKKAREVYEQPIEKINFIYNRIYGEDNRSNLIEFMSGNCCSMVNICFEQNDYKSALEYLERAKNKNLFRQLYPYNSLSDNISEKEKSELKTLELQIMLHMDELSQTNDLKQANYLYEKIKNLINKKNGLTRKVHKTEPKVDFELGNEITYPEIESLINDNHCALIEFYPVEDKIIIFIVLRGKILGIPIYYCNIDELIPKINAYDRDYNNWRLLEETQRNKESYKFELSLDNVLKELYDSIFLKIKAHLKGINKIIMIPYGTFHFLPLHAMFSEIDGERKYLIDEYTISYAPSAKILKLCQKRNARMDGSILVARANPKAVNNTDHIDTEADKIFNLFPHPLSRKIEGTTKKKIISYANERDILHYTGHADYTALYLHNDNEKKEMKKFKIDDIIEHLDLGNTYLATLSACETGVSLPGKTDEYMGLPSAFLCAGAATVISSLWSVRDDSTRLLMEKMYQLIKEGKGKAESLREAQLWLKNPENTKEQLDMLGIKWAGKELPVLDYSRPYHWAPFICTGAE